MTPLESFSCTRLVFEFPTAFQELQEHQQQWPSLQSVKTEPTLLSRADRKLFGDGYLTNRFKSGIKLPTRFLNILYIYCTFVFVVAHFTSTIFNKISVSKWLKSKASKLATATCCQTLSSGQSFNGFNEFVVEAVRFRGNNTRRSWRHNRLSICNSTLDQRMWQIFSTHVHQNINRTIGLLQVFSCFFMFIYIPSMLWLHNLLFFRIIHPKPELFFAFFVGVCSGQHLDMSWSPDHLGGIGVWDNGNSFSIPTQRTSKSERNKIDCSGWDVSL